MRLKSETHMGNITRRGKVKPSLKKDASSAYPAGPILLGFLIFVVIGSAVFQLFRAQLFW